MQAENAIERGGQEAWFDVEVFFGGVAFAENGRDGVEDPEELPQVDGDPDEKCPAGWRNFAIALLVTAGVVVTAVVVADVQAHASIKDVCKIKISSELKVFQN